MSDVTIATLARGDAERLVVAFREYNGSHFVDVRLHFRADDGEWHPTRKGATIRLSELFLVHDALTRACELAKAVKR